MRVAQAKRPEDACVLQELEQKNARLKRLLADQPLDIASGFPSGHRGQRAAAPGFGAEAFTAMEVAGGRGASTT